jgi:hypothetical protein
MAAVGAAGVRARGSCRGTPTFDYARLKARCVWVGAGARGAATFRYFFGSSEAAS